MSIVIHAFPHSPRSFKALAAANHLGVDYEFRLCDLTAGAQQAPAFAALNPNQKAPVLEHDGLALWESNAIIDYLAALKPEAGLAPADARARADMTRWMYWDSTTWDPAVATLAFERVVKPILGIGAPDAAEIEKGEQQLGAAAAILNAHLAGRAFVCGQQITLADFALGSALILEERAALPLGGFAEIKRWGVQLAALPAWRAAQAMQMSARAA